jgi:AraC-like DNA-binding protein
MGIPAGYREWPVPPSLASLVRCGWSFNVESAAAADGPPARDAVLPDGCIDLIAKDGALIVAGPDTAPAPTVRRPGSTSVGLRFAPAAAPGLLGVPASELRDLRVGVAELWGAEAERLEEHVYSARPADRLAVLAALVSERLAGAAPPDNRIRLAVARLWQEPGARLGALERELALSERQLRRRFVSGVGYGPRTFARIARFQRLLSLLGEGEELAAAAAAAGYADQPHMTREAVRLSGATPTALAKRARLLDVPADLHLAPLA